VNQVEYERDPIDPPPLFEMNFEPNDENCVHPLPGDWIFGGPENTDPRADPRWEPMTFLYLDRMLHRRKITQVPRCIHEAIGSQKSLIEKQCGTKIYYITGGLPNEKSEMIYGDPDGAFSAS
jgi:hypothetical protein